MTSPIHPSPRLLRRAPVLGLALFVGVLAGCTSDPDPGEVVVVSHDSFQISDELVAEFEDETGLTLTVRPGGDAVEALNQAILTVDNPQGDVFFGVDDATLSRALDAELFEPHEAEGLDRVPAELRLDDDHRVTPIDHGPVCVNYDAEWFESEGLEVPTSLDDLIDPAYEGLFVTQNPASSTPGLKFLTATIAEYGEDGWLDYWEALRDNGVEVTDGWTDAYYSWFSGPSSEGDRPLVNSYGTSPPFEVPDEEPLPEQGPTGTIESTCTRQIEFAGVLANAENPDGAGELIDFLLSDEFQAEIPLSMFVFPAVDTVELPELFDRYATSPSDPYQLDPELIEAEREEWIREWTDVVLR
ncbi:MAG: thiamine ABC transporter substrate binding subunit [Acidimicrobiales bacterium]